eukprot:TRINITY_DN8908_c0_g1_i11.p1 TRINITY_DN8908_c0_g1~~TRINITY_DN8908_c0_g1_i11.p1  ORF type:complete len:236 (-),score=-17.88 TRINITY_DN8908_c0_g1_i11:318-1025(-)
MVQNLQSRSWKLLINWNMQVKFIQFGVARQFRFQKQIFSKLKFRFTLFKYSVKFTMLPMLASNALLMRIGQLCYSVDKYYIFRQLFVCFQAKLMFCDKNKLLRSSLDNGYHENKYFTCTLKHFVETTSQFYIFQKLFQFFSQLFQKSYYRNSQKLNVSKFSPFNKIDTNTIFLKLTIIFCIIMKNCSKIEIVSFVLHIAFVCLKHHRVVSTKQEQRFDFLLTIMFTKIYLEILTK